MKIGNEDYDLYRVMGALYITCRDLEDLSAEGLRTLVREQDVFLTKIKKKTESLLLAISDLEKIQKFDKKKPVIEN